LGVEVRPELTFVDAACDEIDERLPSLGRVPVMNSRNRGSRSALDDCCR
jgi:hypothetical protein